MRMFCRRKNQPQRTQSSTGEGSFGESAPYWTFLYWGVPAAAGAHAEILSIVCDDLDGAVVAVVFEVCWFVRDGVLAAQFFLNLGKCVYYIANLKVKEGAAASRVGDALENLVARTLGSADVGADGIDDGLGALRHFDGLFARNVAEVIFSVAEQNECTAHVGGLRRLQQFVATCEINRIVERRAAAGAQFAHTVGQGFGVIGEILRDFRGCVKTNHEGGIEARTHRLVQKLDGRFLFELESVAHRVAGVDKQSHLQGQVRFSMKATNNFRGLVVVQE